MTFNFVIPEFNIGGKGNSPFTFYRRGWNLGGSGSTPSWRDIILKGTTALTLVNAKADSLQYLKLFGGTELLAETYLDTVTADGKCVQTNVPKEYTQYEYLQSSGTQYIDTGTPVKANTYVRAEFEFTSSTSSARRLFGKIAGSSTGAMNYREYASFYWFQSNSITTTSSGKHVIEFKSDGNVYLDGTVIGTRGTFSQGSNLPMYLFAELSDGGNINYGSVKVYRFTVSEDTTVVLDLIPCKRNSDDVLGMYDRVSGNFLTNQGTGDFTGNVSSSPTPTPTTPVDIVCNNGVIKCHDNIVNSNIDGQGTFVVPSGSQMTRIYKAFGQLNGTYTVSISGGYELIVQYKDALGTPTDYGNINTWTTSGTYTFDSANTGYYYGIAIRHPDNSTILVADFNGTIALRPQFIHTDGTVETVTDSVGNVATCQNLLAVDVYKDTQEILSGAVSRNIEIRVFDGTENWVASNSHQGSCWLNLPTNSRQYLCLCTHFNNVASIDSYTQGKVYNEGIAINFWYGNDKTTAVAEFKAFLAQQYANGTPVILIRALATATSETVSGQVLQKSPVTYAGSISGLTGTYTESSHTTPKPYQPLQINCNNGVVKINGQGQVYTDGTTEKVEIFGKNLFNINTVTEDIRYNDSGEIVTDSNVWSSDYIPVLSSTDYTYSFNRDGTGGGTARINFFDKQQNWLSVTKANFNGGSVSVTATVTTPSNAYYIRTSQYKDVDNVQLELGSTATDYEPYYYGGSATAEPLYKVSTYQDVQEVLTGEVTRNVGVYVFDGTETFSTSNATFAYAVRDKVSAKTNLLCSHFEYSTKTSLQVEDGKIISFANTNIGFRYDACANTTEFKAWLKSQYDNGTPVVIVYPLAEPTTETVTAQPLTIQAGTNIVEITQASIDNLELEVSYKAGVSVTVTEIENAQLDNSVEVTVNG